jgi:hypothetical protein
MNLKNIPLKGNSGELVINISDSLELSGVDSLFGRTSFILSSAPELNETIQQLFRLPPIPTGEPKNVVINAGRLVLSDAALISVRNDGTGNAGEIQINSPSITLNNAKITATTHSGEGGNIKIASEDIRLLNGSQISATAGGTGNGGNIFLNADTLIALDKKTIVANAFARRGGNISINARAVFTARPINETFDASSQLGIDGTITINTPEIDIEKELEQFNSQIIPIEQVVARSCVTERNARQGSFVITGNGGLPATSETAVDEFHLDEDRGSRADGRSSQLTVSDESDRLEAMPNPSSPEMRSISSVAPWKPGDPIVQGTTLVYTEDGRLLLVAEASSEKVESAEDLVCD